MISTETPSARRVVIVGGGVAALEAVLALHDLAETQVHVTLIAPEPDFSPRSLDVARPFSRGHSSRLPLERFMSDHGGRFRRSAALSVDTGERTIRCATGPDEPYDSLIVAVGAPASAAFQHALTFGSDYLALNGLLADLAEGYTHSVAFVVPTGCTWPLPLYELALMTAEEVWGMGMEDVRMHLLTPELAPLDLFGTEASDAVAELLEAARVTLHRGVVAQVYRGGRIETSRSAHLDVERIVALPVLDGPRFEGLPSDARGFIPVDHYGRVVGVEAVYAAGDATDRPIKQGGLACQQADAAAAHLAAAAGAAGEAIPYAPVLRGRLLTGHAERFLRRVAATGAGEVAARPLWWPPMKVSGRYLSPYLEALGVVSLPVHGDVPDVGIEVDLPLQADSRGVLPVAGA